MTGLKKRRHRRLRSQLAPTRRRVEASARKAVRGQETALASRPDQAPPAPGAATLSKTLRRLSRDLARKADGDAQIKAASRGVGDLSEAYAAIAAAARTQDMEASAKLTAKSVRALKDAKKERRRAGDAWPL